MHFLFGVAVFALFVAAPATASTCDSHLATIDRELKAAESTLSPTRAHGHLTTAEETLAAFAAAGCPTPLLEQGVRQFLGLPPTADTCTAVRERATRYTATSRSWADGTGGFRDRAARTYAKAATFNDRVADTLGCAR